LLHNIKLKLYTKDRKQIHTFINRCQIYPLSYINVDWWSDLLELQGIIEWRKKQN